MNKVLAVSIFIFALFLAYCDLAVTEIDNEDVEVLDTEELNDISSADAGNDIVIRDNEVVDASGEDIIILECKNDRDCTLEKPFCKNNVCVQCITSEDCPNSEVCTEKNECEYVEKTCQKNTDCDMGYICKDKKCTEGCITNKDCPPANKPNNLFCNVNSETPLCVECLVDKDCINAGLGTRCDESNICIKVVCDPPCNEWEHCTNDAKCELNDGACNSDKDCQLVDPKTICNKSSHMCEFKPECKIDTDCDSICPECGGYCKNQRCECIINCPKKGLCEKCTDTKECEVGLECRGLTGKYCQPAGCQTQQDCGGKYCVMGYCACGI